jgi:hypothetical protein
MTTANGAPSIRQRRSRMDGNKLSLAELGDLDLQVAGLGRQQPVPGPVALRGPGARPLEAFSAYSVSRLGIDEGFEHELDASAHDVDIAAGAYRIE